jgi:hypothetical protein
MMKRSASLARGKVNEQECSQRQFTERCDEAQFNRASAFSLIIHAIVVWNTRHFDRAQAKLLEQGELVDEGVWQHLSPLAWKHINLVGSYHFSDVHLEGEFCPLREGRERPSQSEKGLIPPLERTETPNEGETRVNSPVEDLPTHLSLFQEEGEADG